MGKPTLTLEQKRETAQNNLIRLYNNWRSRLRTREGIAWAEDTLWPAIQRKEWKKVALLTLPQKDKLLQALREEAVILVNLPPPKSAPTSTPPPKL